MGDSYVAGFFDNIYKTTLFDFYKLRVQIETKITIIIIYFTCKV